ncbi:MAG: cation:proton antiporter [Gammaproteobacteria bacterium]|nr:cation:proton antiporter [Gammaproteobacteria bacterium]
MNNLNHIEIISLILICAAALMALYRIVFGPENADRIISADALSLISTILLVLLAMVFDSSLYIDIALIYAVLSFVGIIAIAKVIEPSENILDKNLGKEE